MNTQEINDIEIAEKSPSLYTYFDRDLSWLSFNYRVLMEAKDKHTPLYERLRFLAIYSSNQDEFFRVRVSAIRRLVEINKKKINKELDFTPKKLIDKIGEIVALQLNEFGNVYQTQLSKGLGKNGIYILKPSDLTQEQKNDCLFYFKTKVLAFLKPYIFNVSKRKPFLDNRKLYLALLLENKKTKETGFGYLNIPSELPRFHQLPSSDFSFHYIFLDDVIVQNLDFMFSDYSILECKSIKINKDADLNIKDDFSGDLADKIQKQIEKRNLGAPSRFLYDKTMSIKLLTLFQESFSLNENDLVQGGQHHGLTDYFQFPNPIGKSLEYVPMVPLASQSICAHRSIFTAIDEKDQMLHFPYHSFDYVLQFFNQAASDLYVTEINVTFYRIASESLIGNALISAAQNGKKVTVFIELKARFDEENNMMWAEKMKKAGVRIFYGIPNLKVHAKIALIKKKTERGLIKKYCFLGTGNLNEKTAEIYTDHGLFTSHKKMGVELEKLFSFLHKQIEPPPFKHLLVSQFNMIDRFIALIDREISNVNKGGAGRIVIKLNNLEERKMIDKLYEASNAGVKIDLIIRGICCLIPGEINMSKNITVRRIVGRFLEHSRVFWFYNNDNSELFMGSADWMKRNLYHRIEVVFPVYDEVIKMQVVKLLRLQLQDNIKATITVNNQENIKIKREKGEHLCNAQMDAYNLIKRWEEMEFV